MRGALLVLLVACGDRGLPTGSDTPAEVRTWLEGEPKSGSGTVVVQAQRGPGVELEVALPEVPGLVFTPVGEPRVEQIGDREVVTNRWTFSGKPGHYTIPGFEAVWTGPDGPGTSMSSPLYVDLDVESLAEGDLADISEPSRVWEVPWRGLAGAAALGALVAGGVGLAFRRRDPSVTEVPPEPPDVLAIRSWEAIRRDPSLDDNEKAKALSRIFREYVEAALHHAATSSTTTETLAYLKSLPHLEEGNVPRARALLRATDRVKYADARAGEDLFEELDADLRAFVGSTRPYRWQGYAS